VQGVTHLLGERADIPGVTAALDIATQFDIGAWPNAISVCTSL
jgi:hypothetical protein